jgi:hypothetical protein
MYIRTLHRSLIFALLAVSASTGCRDYNYKRHVADQAGLIPADQYARYGREQAITVAIGREFARPYNSGPEAQADVAINYARNTFGKDIADISADPLGNRLVVTFKSGWRAAIVPIDDGKTGSDTKIPS